MSEDSKRPVRVPRPMAVGERVVLFSMIVAVGVVLVALAFVTPDSRGYGTHEQLGMLPCSWPTERGMPCPTCGVTTAGSLLVHLRPLAAIDTQPFGALVTGAGIAFLVLATLHLWRGESLFARIGRWPLGTITFGVVLVLVISWLWCISQFTPAAG